MKQQIGWYNLKEDNVFTNTYECAAWYENVLVKAGRYPVVVYDYNIRKSNRKSHDNEVCGHINGAYTSMDGTVVSDEFGARFYGVPVESYDNHKNAGKPSSHSMMCYMYIVADSILNEPDSPWELLPEYEAREIRFEYDGEEHVTYGIFKVEKGEAA